MLTIMIIVCEFTIVYLDYFCFISFAIIKSVVGPFIQLNECHDFFGRFLLVKYKNLC